MMLRPLLEQKQVNVGLVRAHLAIMDSLVRFHQPKSEFLVRSKLWFEKEVRGCSLKKVVVSFIHFSRRQNRLHSDQNHCGITNIESVDNI